MLSIHIIMISPIGTLKIVANEAGILSVLPSPMPASYDTPHTPHIADTVQWLNRYFKDKSIGQIPSISAKITPWQWELNNNTPGTNPTIWKYKNKKSCSGLWTGVQYKPYLYNYSLSPCGFC